jgi:hypothetical protein
MDHGRRLCGEGGAVDTRGVLPRTPARAPGPQCPARNCTEVTTMATTWELMAVCLEDAARAEDLVRELGFRRELRLDPQEALSAFELRRTKAGR